VKVSRTVLKERESYKESHRKSSLDSNRVKLPSALSWFKTLTKLPTFVLSKPARNAVTKLASATVPAIAGS
jgi:hypothetical protein